MKYIIKESQYKNLFEGKSGFKNLFQQLIDEKLDLIRSACSDNPTVEIVDIGWDTCEQIDYLDGIEVIDVETVYSKKQDDVEDFFFKVNLICKTQTLRTNFDEVVFDLKTMIKKITGFPLVFDYEIKKVERS